MFGDCFCVLYSGLVYRHGCGQWADTGRVHFGDVFSSNKQAGEYPELLLDIWIHFNAFPIESLLLCVVTKPPLSVSCVVFLSFTLFIH